MTDEEKIQEMAFEAIPENISYSTVIDRMVDYNGRDRDFFIDGARAAMEWKEQQMIEKAVEWLKNNIHDYYNGDSEFAVCNWLTEDEFINNFKKAMKGE